MHLYPLISLQINYLVALVFVRNITEMSEMYLQKWFCPNFLSESPKFCQFFVRIFLSEIFNTYYFLLVYFQNPSFVRNLLSEILMSEI